MRRLHLAAIAWLLISPNAWAIAQPPADVTVADYVDGTPMREQCAKIIKANANGGDRRTAASYLPASVVFRRVPGSWSIERGANFESAILVEFRATAVPSMKPTAYRAACYFKGDDFDEMSVDPGSPPPSGHYGTESVW
jgi:hypothetical protein